jgi:PAS domain S-box-containing protein
VSQSDPTNTELLKEAETLRAQLARERDVTVRLLRVASSEGESEQRFKELAGLLPQTVYEVGLDGRLTFVNRQALEMFGYTRAEFEAGVNCFQMLAAHEHDRARHNLQFALDGPDLGGIEYTGQRKDGTQFPVVVYSSPILSDGVPAGLRGIIIDVTERKRAEDALRDSEARFRCLIEGAPEAIFVQSAGRFAYLNPAACRLLGASQPEDLLGKDFMARIPPEYRDAVRERIRLQCQTGRPAPLMEQSYLRLDGSRVPVETTAVPVRYQGADAHLVFVRDITERKRAIEAVRKGRDYTRSILRSMADMLVVVSPGGRIVTVNEAICQSLGYPKHELIGQPATLLFEDEDEEEDEEEDNVQLSLSQHVFPVKRTVLRRLVKQGSVRNVEKSLRTKSGARIPVLLSGSVMRNNQREIRAIVCVASDITDRKRAEEELRESRRRQAEAEKLAATGRMAARIAHEINNPLAGIKNAFRLIRDAVPEDHPDRDMAERIDREIARISNIVQQMYTLYSPKAAQITEVAVDDAIRDVLAMLEPLRRESEVQFDATHVLPGLIALAPEGGLRQILYNLTTNAIEASPPGGVITIAAELDDSRPDLVRISVHNRGEGISPNIQPRIFEPFFTSRTDNHTKGGLGLGLSVVKSVVEAAGGRIDFDSAPGQGTTFRVFLPKYLKTLEQ